MGRQLKQFKLTEEQKKVCEDNLGLFYHFLNNNNFYKSLNSTNKDELSSHLMYYFCLAIYNFDFTKSKLSTYWYIQAPALIRRFAKSQLMKKTIRFNVTEHDVFKEDEDIIEIEKLIDCDELDSIEKKILTEYYLNQKTSIHIQKHLKISRYTFKHILDVALSKIKKYADSKKLTIQNFI